MTFNLIEQSTLAILIIGTLTSFSLELFKRYKIIMQGTGSFPFDNIHIRLKRVFVEFVLQKKVLTQRFFPD